MCKKALKKFIIFNNVISNWNGILSGPLQSNKSRLVAEHFDWVETVDRLKIAERLSQQRPTALEPLNVLIQDQYQRRTVKIRYRLGSVATACRTD